MSFSRILLGAAVLALACSCSTKEAPPTTIEGTVSPEGYPARPISVVITDDRGTVRTIALSADGRFSTELPKRHSYRLEVGTEQGLVPVVFPRRSTRIDTRFTIATNGARIALGAVRYHAATPASGAPAVSSSAAFVGGASASRLGPQTLRLTDAEENEVEVEDDDEVECQDGSQGHDENIEQGGENVSAIAAVAVPEKTPPESAAGCEEDDDDDDENEDHDDGEEGNGEHED